MSTEVLDLRKGERFIVTDPMAGSFSGSEITVLNISLTGLQITHAQPIRIGTRSRLTFRHGDVDVATQARVIWSHFSNDGGKLVYHTGLRLENADSQYAMAINALIRGGVLRQDVDSMERKRARMIEREEQRKSQMKIKPPTAGGIEPS